MGLDVVLDGGYEAQSTDGADGSVDIQLLESFYADGDGKQTWRGNYDAATAPTRGGAANANQMQISIASLHGKAKKIAYTLSGISAWFQGLQAGAEQLAERLQSSRIVKRVIKDFGHFPLDAPRTVALDATSNCRI